MSRKQYSKELKLELVKKHLEDGISYWKLGKEYGIEASIIRRWGYKYETFGEDGLEKQNADLCNYSSEFKKKIVLEYLGGNITSQDLAFKYKIHAPSTVRKWIKQYNNHEDLTDSRKESVYLMVKNGARKNTTLVLQYQSISELQKLVEQIDHRQRFLCEIQLLRYHVEASAGCILFLRL